MSGEKKRGRKAGKAPAKTPGRKPDKLTHLEELFAVEYVIDWNGAAAVRRAGYKVKSDVAAGVQANRLLKKAKVLARVETAKAEALERAGIRAEAVLLELAKIGFASKRRIMGVDEDGQPFLRPGSEIPDADLDAVQDFSFQVIEIETPTKEGIKVERRRSGRVKMHDKRAALVDLGKYIGIFGPEKVQVSTPEGQPLQVENVNAIPEVDRAERVAALIAAATARKTDADR
ncbi:terminase small subunit [Deinococcus multiflagellatus]|uniref:Terminase small subunit n=1 Tax=Deinococcus multiflagellatus TaxID=1656887 RepID=A0ABW1ZH30_9DEIO|nr:terminase small subunit [Deinococcus multiflagellatus]MBZ9712198.1 terminase small subunit [Deinococcus multiflagellatus]